MPTSERSRPRPRLLAPLALTLAALLASGCGEAEEPGRLARRTMTVEAVPQAARDAAARELPGITIEEAWGNVDAEGTIVSYELRGRSDQGRIREARVTADGQVLETE